MAELYQAFDVIYWTLGNHDVRMLRALEFGIGLAELAKLVDGTGKMQCSYYRYAIINKTWRVSHPKSYSRRGGQVPSILADKFKCSVIGAHGHHWGIQPALNNEYVGIDTGGMFDPTRVDYIMLEDSTHPMWTPGFGIIRNNTYYMFTDNPRLTDWDFWLGNGEKKCSKKKRSRKTS